MTRSDLKHSKTHIVVAATVSTEGAHMKCPACQFEISSSATRCPHCTSKLTKYSGVGKKDHSVALFGAFAFALGFGFIGMFFEVGFIAAGIGFVVGYINAWFSGMSGTSAE